MGTWFDFLTSSHTVAKFQTAFGVEIIHTAVSNGYGGLGQPSGPPATNGLGVSTDAVNSKYCSGNGHRFSGSCDNNGEINRNTTRTVDASHGGESSLRTRVKDKSHMPSSTSRYATTTAAVEQESPGAATGRPNGSVQNGMVNYKIHNMAWYYIFQFGASLGNETFFITFLPFCCWHLSLLMIRRLIVMWCLVMYLGQGAKDIVKWPRPSSPPVVKLEHLYHKEYGMPSTHAMMGLSLPVTILYLSNGRYEFPFIAGVIMVIAWCSVVCCSRLYLGMHSVLDIIVGLIFSAIIVAVVAPYLHIIDEFFCRHEYGAITALVVGITMSVCYPTLDRWSAARGDATLILGVATGAMVGMWLKNYYNILPLDPVEPLPYDIPIPDLKWFVLMVVKTLIGLPVLLLTRLIMKPLTYAVVCFILGIPHSEAKATERVVVELPRKFFTYMAVVLNACLTVPSLYVYLGLV
ncbi:sphingosine-1-phosphate phosphatase 2-like [Ptychodera flava]|uniref:sphingosine-1-phosphate phosphatase 2-like n=1 Tax=Ptychodera flava TaxID=63121 RepID=UPI00396A804B